MRRHGIDQSPFCFIESSLLEEINGTKVVLASEVGPERLRLLAGGAAGIAVLMFAYREVISDLWNIWATNQDYSHGMLVLPFALYLAWRMRKALQGLSPQPSLAGLGILLGALALRVAGVQYYSGFLERLSLVISIWGLVVLLCGWRIARLMRGPLAFLLLMIPPPNSVAQAIALPLQRLSAVCSAAVLKVMGWDAVSEGNVIRLYGQDLEVAAACNGLRMVFAIVTLGCAMAYLARRPRWERFLVAASSVPIGVAVNVVRIVATGIVSQVFLGLVSVGRVHDVAGWLMMPVALLVIWWEQGVLRSVMVERGPLG